MRDKHKLIAAGVLEGGASDTAAPTVAITSTETSPSFANPIPMTFTLSEVSTDFAVGSLTIGAGGSIGNFAGSSTAYTADLTITTAGATPTVDVAAGAFHDAAGNANLAATQFSITSALAFKDEFTTADDSPVTSPRTCEPGPGTLTFVQTDGTLAISGGKLNFTAQATPAQGDLGGYGGNVGWAAGRAILFRLGLTSTTVDPGCVLGLRNSTGLSTNINFDSLLIFRFSALTSIDLGVANSVTITGFAIDSVATSDRNFCIVPGATPYFIQDSTLLWVGNAAFANAFPLFENINAVGSIERVRSASLSAPWVADYGIATNRVASPSVGEITTSEANALIEMTWQAVAGQTWNLMVRRTNDDNAWYVRCDQAGGTIKLIERNAGVETERASAAQTWNNGTNYRVVVVQYGNTIKTYVANVSKNSYASASFNNTATGVKTDRAGTNLIAWPRTLSGAALTELNKLTNP